MKGRTKWRKGRDATREGHKQGLREWKGRWMEARMVEGLHKKYEGWEDRKEGVRKNEKGGGRVVG